MFRVLSRVVHIIQRRRTGDFVVPILLFRFLHIQIQRLTHQIMTVIIGNVILLPLAADVEHRPGMQIIAGEDGVNIYCILPHIVSMVLLLYIL